MERIEKLKAQFAEYNIDGLLITSTYNRRYMTGFTGTAGVAIVSESHAVFITDFRYVEQAQSQAVGYEIVQHSGPIHEEIATQLKRLGIKKLGFEKDHVSYSTYDTYEKVLETTLVPVSGLMERLRLVKDEKEIAIIQEAVDIADAAFEHIQTYIRAGVKEIDVSNELEFFMRKQGAVSSSFDIIVASGYRSALPHGVASDKVIEKGELVTLDFGAYYKGYCSDITRTVAVGEPSKELVNIYKTVLEAQLKGVQGIKPGMTGIEADALTRDHIKSKGYGEYFGHSTGHGLGMEVHEGPGLSFRSNTKLEAGMVVTVEPGIYIAGLGGTRIEDDIVITENGNKILSKSPKELIILGE
ncbi:M24 family metallopeptidase [Evansella cellulosilytica]|uniref:Peptidase M24 n=1 Tax=Evansella cellulosilytica (strain ATCC 21833 / DSM 2522 / FERM P-1141 / JCM 9156 / N-4) TaxID=649639 RepID=E6TXN4_EVAC2|nr:Xaa-Pro peptidase family protein [Evansella cellulosilytica]ADU29960.1 peptidase M24 [Evansella cellulosilytica DSM 2522]